MIETQLTLDDIIQMTMDVGEDWAVAHAERLIETDRVNWRGNAIRYFGLGIGGIHARLGSVPRLFSKGCGTCGSFPTGG